MAAAPSSNQHTQRLDERLRHETVYGTQCEPDSHIARLSLNRHEACAGWWETRQVDNQPVGFRCACPCHDPDPDRLNQDDKNDTVKTTQ